MEEASTILLKSQSADAVSDSAGEDSSKSEVIPLHLPLDKRICLVGSVVDDPTSCRAAQSFGFPILTSVTGADYAEDTTCLTVFVTDMFEGPQYDFIHRSKHRILGPTALQQLSERNEPLKAHGRPLYSLSMSGVVVCFTGFRKKEELTRLIMLIHNMGGSIRKDMVSKVTHLIANSVGGDKYQYAQIFHIPVMSSTWVEHCWDNRNDPALDAVNPEVMMAHKLKPFAGARVCFLGFPADEHDHMAEILIENGGTVVDIDHPQCTHAVLPNGDVYCSTESPFPFPLSPSAFLNLNSPESSSSISNPDYGELKTKSTQYLTSNELSVKKLGRRSMLLRGTNNKTLKAITERSMEADVMSMKNLSMNERKSIVEKKRMFNFSPEKEFVVDYVDNTLFNVSLGSINDEVKPSPAKRLRQSSPIDSASKTQFLSPSTSINCNEASPCLKRARDSFDNISQISTISVQSSIMDKYSPPNFSSAKKPKLNYKPSIKRSISFASMKSPLTNMLSTKFKKTGGITRKKKVINETVDGNLHEQSSFMSTSGIFNISSLSKKCNNVFKKRQSQNCLPLSFSKDITSPDKSRTIIQDIYTDNNVVDFKTPKTISSLSRHSICLMTSGIPTDPLHSLSEVQGSAKTSTPHSHLLQLADDVKRTLKSSVIDESTTSTLPEPLAPNTHIVKAEWFWTSVQNMGCADVKDYLFEDYLEGLQSPSRKESRATPGGSSNRLRKRKRLQETLNALAQGETTVIHKRRSSVSDAGLLSVSGSFLDCTATPDKNILEELEPGKNLSPRQHVFLELVQTESNYVNILNTIMTMFKDPLEKMTEVGDGQSSEPLLNNTELKIIFGNLPPIYEIHQRMLEELRWSSSHWTEETSIGSIVLKYSNDLVKAYPPFVNFFENMKDMLVQCDQNKPRFHAFLKICQTKPECGRQSLQELLIRPVQRLPSISLLLNDILKHTSKNNPDHSALEKALEAIKEVMTNINEDKRRTEAQLVMFDIFNEIDNCPPHLVSSHRSFISRCEVMELSEGLSGRGNHLMMFLFSDILEVCKKRSKASNVKSPTSLNGLHHSNKLSSVKPYKHIKLFPLSHIKRVVDIQETIDYQKVFAIMCRSNQELKEKLYSFQIMDMDVDKNTFLRTLCRQMANTVCKADADTFLACLKSQDLEIDTSDINVGTLSKAFKFASRTRMKVGRAFSFNKTPSKLKRAVSTMMSPFGSTTNLTPASHLAQMRLASCTNINEIGTESDSPNSEVLVAPMSVQPTRKAKCSSLSVGALRRL